MAAKPPKFVVRFASSCGTMKCRASDTLEGAKRDAATEGGGDIYELIGRADPGEPVFVPAQAKA